MGAHERERELAGEQLVIGEPRPGFALRKDVGGLGRVMQALQGLGEGGKALAFDPGRVLPLRQPRDFREGGFGGLAHRVQGQTFG